MTRINSLGFPDYNLNGIPFNSGTPDSVGSYWFMDGEMTGWDSADGRVTMLTKIGIGPNADGEIPADQHYRGRTITFKLYAACYSEANREASRLLLAQSLDLVNSTGTLTVNEATPKNLTITRSGNSAQGKLTMIDRGFSLPPQISRGLTIPQPTDPHGLFLLETDIEVYAPDPRKYAVTALNESGASASFAFTNPGNTATSNIFLNLPSPGPGDFGVSNGSGIFFQMPATPGPALPGFPSTLYVDVYNNKMIDLAGDNFYFLRYLAGAPPWPFFSPGSNTVAYAGGASTFSLSFYPAWI